jgi:Na+-transporting NADH:ubiquinone oxidoreductase subunit A
MGAPQQRIEDGNPVNSVAVLGSDYPGIKPRLMVQEGDRVKLGQTLFISKLHQAVHFTSPGSGVVQNIVRGPKRVFRSIEIKLEGNEEERFDDCITPDPSTADPEKIRQGLLASGLWSAFRTRPYSRIPGPRQKPRALFVTAVDTNPLSANPAVVIDQSKEAFRTGLDILSRMTEGKIFVCSAAGESLPVPDTSNIQLAEFSGPHPSGLVGTHIHFLAPVSARRTVWHLGYQDVIAIGEFFTTGRLKPERVIAIAGPVVKNPRLIRTRLGASTNELVNNELDPVPSRVVSGSILSGHHAAGWAAYLGRYHHQISVLPDSQEREFMGWLSPGMAKFSSARVLLSSIFKRSAYWMSTLQNGSPRAMVPIGSYERVMPLDILPTQLLRALLVNDTETAQGLGALELDEEDLALCSYVCPSKYDYGPVLRRNLDLIRREG